MSANWGLTFSLVLVLLVSSMTGAQAPPPAAQCVPQDALICLQTTRPEALIDLLAGKEMTAAITSLPLYQQQSSNPKFNEFVNVIKYLETTLGTDWRTALATLTADGITLAVCPQDRVVVIIDGQDESMLQKLHEIFLNFARGEAQKQGQSERVASKEYRGATTWTFNGQEAHAVAGKRFIFANRPEALAAVLDLQARQGASLATNPTFQAAMQAKTPSAAATAFVNLAVFRQLPQMVQLLEKQNANPLAALVFAGIAESVRTSNWLGMALDVEGRTLTVRALADGKAPGPTSPAAFAVPQKAGDGAWPNLVVPRRIAALSLYRDLHSFYAAKDTLFPNRTSGLIFFENMMGIFFTGRDLTSEVLAETQPEVRVVVAEQQYDPAVGTPLVRIPAFAVILRLRHPEQSGKVVEEAWQKAIGLVNFTRGQQAQPGLIIDRPTHDQISYTVAAFSAADAADKTKLEQRFNFRPALALPGEYLILSSTDGLARDLIDALAGKPARAASPLAQTHSLLEIDGPQVGSILLANRETLIQGDMVKKGRSREQAEAGIDMFITLSKFIDQMKLSMGVHENLTHMQLETKLNLSRR